MHKYIEKAAKEAIRHTYDVSADYKLAAVIVKGGAIISIGFNKRNTNAFVEHYINLACMAEGTVKDFCGSTHAEMDAVLQCRSKTDLRGAKIYVARVRKAKDMGTLAMAKPCRICQMVLNAYGIKRAIYSIDDLNFGVLKITEEGEG